MSKFILTGFADEIDTDLQTQLDALAELKINYIEMRGVNGKGLVEYSLEEAKEIKKQLADHNVKLSAVGSPIGKQGITDNFEPHLDLFKHTLDIARIMEAPYIRMFSFWIPKNEDPANYRNAVIDRWGAFVEAAKGSGIILLHENEKNIYGDTAERCLDLLSALDSDYVKAIFDPANFIQCDEETFPKAWNLLEKYVIYMHIKDANFSDHKVVPPGHGDGKLPEILKELKKKDTSYFLSLEPHLNGYKGPATVKPESPGFNLPEGRPKLFALACQELRKILDEI